LAEQMPEFPGGQEALNAYLAKEVNYPEVAKAHGVNGTVVVEFVVEKDGSISNATIKTPLFLPCDKEVLRVISSMPKWIPARNKGVPVRSFMQIPVTFQM
ncbi:MAG: energy transducer TonB, partial [Bacteroidales bacterium]|nr:energy transducer TonB [Bacteroidales bacterium]